MIDPNILRAFSVEMQKQANPIAALPLKVLLPATAALTLATGYTGKRLVDDIKMGEQMRRGGYY